MRLVLIGGGGAVGRDLTLALRHRGIDFDVWERDYYTLEGGVYSAVDASPDRIGDIYSAEKRLWVNLAGLGDAYQCDYMPQAAVKANTELAGTYSRLAAVRETPLLHLSTWEVYGGSEGAKAECPVLNEESMCSPSSVYARTKYYGESLSLQIGEILDNRVAVLRIGPVVGPNMRRRTAVRSFIEASLRDEQLQIAGTGRQIRQFLDYRDLARAVQLFAEADEWRASVYNIASADPVSVRQLAQLIRDMSGKGELVRGAVSREEPGQFLLSTDRVLREHQWEAEISIAETLEHVLGLWSSEAS